MIRRIIWVTAASFCLLLLILVWLTQTNSGLRAGLGLVNRLEGIHIEHKGLEGNLSQFETKKLVINTGELALTLNGVHLNWKPIHLLKQKLLIQKLELEVVQATYLPSEGKNQDENTLAMSLPELPLQVFVENLMIGSMLWQQQPIFTNLSLKAALEAQSWKAQIKQLSLPQGQIVADLSIEPSQLQHQLEVLAKTAEYGEIKLSLKGNQNLSKLLIVEPASELELKAAIRQWTISPDWQLEIQSHSLDHFGVPGNIQLSAKGTSEKALINGQIELQGKRIDLSETLIGFAETPISIQGKLLVNDLWPINLDALINESGLPKATLSLSDPTSLNATMLNNQQSNESDLDLTLEQAVFEVNGLWDHLTFLGKAAGTLNEELFQFDLDAELLKRVGLKLGLFELAILDGQLSGVGSIDLETLKAELDMGINDIKLNKLDAQYPEQFDANLTLTADTIQRFSVDLKHWSMVMREELFLGHGQFKWQEDQMTEANLTMSNKGQEILAVKLVEPSRQSISMQTQIGDLSILLPNTSGSIEGNLKISVSEWQLDGEIELNQFETAGINIKKARFSGDSTQAQQALQVSLDDVRYSKQKINRITAKVSGAPESHSATLNMLNGHSGLQLEWGGKFDHDSYQATIQKLYFDAPETLGTLSNDEPLSLTINQESLIIEPFCWSGEIGSVCAELSNQRIQEMNLGQIKADINLTPQGRIAAFANELKLPIAPLIQKIDFKAKAEWESSKVQARIEGLASQLAINHDTERVDIGDLNVELEVNETQAIYDFLLNLPNGQIKTHGTVTDLLTRPSIDGQINGQLNDLKKWSPWLGEVEIKDGGSMIDLQINGFIDDPQLTGQAAINRLSIPIPSLEIVPVIDLAVDLNPSTPGTIEGGIKLGQAIASVNGQITSASPLALSLTVSGEDLLLADSKSISLQASPDLKLNLSQGELTLIGDVAVTRAYTKLTGVDTNGGPLRSNDIIIVDSDIDTPVDGTPLNSNLDLSLGFTNPGQIEGYGLQGQIEGKIRIRQRDNGPTIANGELALTGRYQAYGQDLIIERGRIIYANSSLENPVIDAFASRTIEDVKVGIKIDGRPDALVTELQSDNNLSESDILSYLVLGRATDGISDSQADSNLLAAAAASFALQSSVGVIDQLGESLGNTQLSLTDEIGGLALAVGKQLSPKLYIGYTVGLLEPIDIATIRYRINQNWALESELADEARASIRYQIKKK